jgi:hypothetical protein
LLDSPFLLHPHATADSLPDIRLAPFGIHYGKIVRFGEGERLFDVILLKAIS